MRWMKRGLIYNIDNRLPWARTHSQIPTIDVHDRHLNVLFSCRDENIHSYVVRLELDASNPSNVLYVQSQPVMSPGSQGAFDDCGVMPSSIVDWQGVKYLFYIGWNVRNTVPYHNSIGLAISDDGGHTFRRLFDGPVMDRTPEEPYFCGTSCVRIENGIWRNWYMSCTDWQMVGGRAEPRYHLKYAESKDGIHWQRHGTVAIDYVGPEEGGIARASVCKDGNLYRMWYCYRGLDGYREVSSNSYRIGYAESRDGIRWTRRDEDVGISVSESDWDSFMMAYPEVVDVRGRRYLFYNGNGFGQTGFGYAEAAVQ